MTIAANILRLLCLETAFRRSSALSIKRQIVDQPSTVTKNVRSLETSSPSDFPTLLINDITYTFRSIKIRKTRSPRISRL